MGLRAHSSLEGQLESTRRCFPFTPADSQLSTWPRFPVVRLRRSLCVEVCLGQQPM